MAGVEASRARKVLLVFAGIVFASACFVGVGATFCAATLHVPRRGGAAPPGAVRAEILAGDGARLVAWWIRPASSNGACVLVLHGIGDSGASAAGFAPLFLAQGYSVLAPDSRAHGESGGQFVTYGLLEKYDATRWVHWMRSQGCVRIYGLGESLGASVLIQASAVEPSFNAIVAECPYANLRAMGEYRLRGMLPLPAILADPLASVVVEAGMFYARAADGLDFRQVSPLHSILTSSAPVLLIHGLDDRRTPPDQSRQLAAVCPARDRLWLVPHAGHTNALAVAPEEFRRRVLGWFAGN